MRLRAGVFGLFGDNSGTICRFSGSIPSPALTHMAQCVYTWAMKKVRTVFQLDEADRKTLEKLSQKTGAPVAELLRRAVAAYLKDKK